MSADTPPPTLPHITNMLSSVANGLSTLDESRSTTAQDREGLHKTLKKFFANPTVLKLTAHSLTTPPAQTDELKEIKKNLSMLIKTVNSLHQKASTPPNQLPLPPPSRAKDVAKPPLPSYANITASRSSRANLVMDLKDLDFGGPKLRPMPAYLTDIFNDALKSSPLHQVHIAATRWTAKGNLVITGGHLTTAQQLRDCTATLSKALSEDQSVPECDPIPYPLIRPNIKWSKILINGIPTCYGLRLPVLLRRAAQRWSLPTAPLAQRSRVYPQVLGSHGEGGRETRAEKARIQQEEA
jgi:hypothetical protein